MRVLRRAIGVILIIFVCLTGVLVVNALRFVPAPADANIEPATPLDINVAEAAARLSSAIQLETVSHQNPGEFPPEVFRAFHALLEEKFPLVHANLQREIVNEFSLLYTWSGLDPALAPVVLMNHMDVVPISPGTERDWEHAPFSGEISGGFVWGRGSLDDKAGVMAIMEAAEQLLAAGHKPKRTVYFAFGHDEEISGANGALKIVELLKSRGVSPEFVLDEGGSITQGIVHGVAPPVALIGVAEKGYLSVELTVSDKGGHSSQPPRNTAIGVLSAAVTRLESNPLPPRFDGPGKALFQSVAPSMPFLERMIFGNLWLTEPIVIHILSGVPSTNAAIRTTTAVTVFDGGVKENVLPASARCVVNFRLLPGDTSDSVIAHVRNTIADGRVKVRSLGSGHEASPSSDPSAPAFGLVRRTINQVCGSDVIVAPYLVLGATDARYYYAISKNVYRFSPARFVEEDLKRVHGTNERIGIDNYAEIIRFYAQLMRNTDSL